MCSFDIKRLFTNVPLDETISICIKELYDSNISPPLIPEEVCQSLLYKAFKNVEFRFNTCIYRQVDGVAMWSPLGPVLASIFFCYFKSILFTHIEKPLNYFRHVDNIFISYKKSYNINALFYKISNLQPSIKFTYENKVDGSIITSIYRKPVQ